nr:13690_t:CDS:2 [Entrophospora candida]
MAKQIICPKCGYIFAKEAENEFKRLSNITGDYEKNLIFREQQLGPALKRRVIAVYNAKVHKKNVRESKKKFRELLEKEFDKRGQFKFALCSLTKFLLDVKPENEKKNTTNKL